MNVTTVPVSERGFSTKECFAVAWARFKERPWFLMGITLFSWGIAFLAGHLTDDVYRHIEPTRTLIDILSSVAYYWIYFGMTVVTLKLVDGERAGWADVFVFDRRFPLYILGSLLYAIVVLVGLFAFVIPGIYLALRYGFYWFAIIDGRKGVFDAFHESARITTSVKWQLILFGLASLLVIFLGFLALGVGVLAAVPVSLLASTHLYRVLLNQNPRAAQAALVPSSGTAVSSDAPAA